MNPNEYEAVNFRVSVSSQGEGRTYIHPDNGTFSRGEKVRISAEPDSGSLFMYWSGDIRNTQKSLELEITKSLSVTAHFREVQEDSSEMVHIPSKGLSFTSLNGPEYSFTYPLFADRYEVTQKEFSELMGYNPVSENGFDDNSELIGDSLPVSFVSLYEAMLFCNEKSKAKGYDTVYTYNSVCPDTLQCGYVLEDLEVRYDRYGYRLPTDAEFELMCRGGRDSEYFFEPENAGEYSWYTENSSGTIHLPGRKLPNPYGLYDIAGNAAEWVNDRLKDIDSGSVLTNFTSDPCTNISEECEGIARGGSYRQDLKYLKSHSRENPYPVAPGAGENWIGFRTVLGVFFDQEIITDTTGDTPVHENLIKTNRTTLISNTGTDRIRVVFSAETDQGLKILLYDPANRGDSLISFQPESVPYGLSLSPDSRYAAYSSSGLGFSKDSRVWVHDLTQEGPAFSSPEGYSAYLPEWWVDTAGLDTFIIASESSVLNTRSEWRGHKTYKFKFSGTGISQSHPDILTEKGAYHGGLSADGSFLATGYPKARILDLRLDDKMEYFRSPENGLNYDVQVCNVSVSPGFSNPDRIILLDFGTGGEVSSVTGRAYRSHEYIFMCSSAKQYIDHVNGYYYKPAGYSEWKKVSYTNSADYAVAIASDNDKDAVFLIDLSDSSYIEIAEGKNINEADISLELESADPKRDHEDFGSYDIPYKYSGQVLLTQQIKKFWYNRGSVEVLITGNSHAFFSFDPSEMSMNGINLASTGHCNLLASRLTENYGLTHAENLKAVVMNLNAGGLGIDYNPEDPFLNGLYDSKGYILDRENSFWKDSIPGDIQSRISGYNDIPMYDMDETGFFPHYAANGWGDTLIEAESYAYSFSDSIVGVNLAILEKTAEMCRDAGVHLIVVKTPQNPLYKETDYAGRYGPSNAVYDSLTGWLQGLSGTNPYFHFYDAHKNGEHDYTDNEAFDSNHLNATGAKKLSSRIDSIMTEILD
ncbi:MAG: SUMF1/EgtB/PvdO family nonheme iron enzyme [Chitinivibrionales bacterium]